jgi:hypothetical protein
MKPIHQNAAITNSHGREQRKMAVRPLQSETREVVSNLIESLIGHDWRSSHRFDLMKDGPSLQRDPYYVYKREGRERPGLLLLYSADQPAVFWDMDKDEPNSVRLQIPFGFLKSGPSVFSVTLLKVEGRLIFEDVWVLHGKKLLGDMPYSQRWINLREVHKQFSSQQMFLGYDIVTVEPMSLQEFLECEPEPGSIWDFQPEAAGRKRLYWMCPGVKLDKSAGAKAREEEQKLTAAAAQMLSQQPRIVAVNKNALKRNMEVHNRRTARLKAHPSGFPDTYVLDTSDNKSIGVACIAKIQQSKEIKDALSASATKSIIVDVIWHEGFNKYQIESILPAETPLSPYSSFHECHTPLA